MEFRKFLEFIYFNSLTLSVNFLDHLVIDMSESVLKSLAPSRNGSMMIVIFLHKLEERRS